jgi:hypothetical protein
VKVKLSAAIAVAITGTATGAADDKLPSAPLFEAAYETPFGSIGTAQSGGAGGVWFRVWKMGEYGSDVLSGHLYGHTDDCWSSRVHFCITHGYIDFAVPPANAPIGWTLRVGISDIRLISRQKIFFRGQEIPVLTLVATDSTTNQVEEYFVYNYDTGLIAFANVRSDSPPSTARVPLQLKDTFILGNDSGLGGRENCKHWKCGSVR